MPMPAASASRGLGDAKRFAVPGDRAAIGMHETGKDFQQRRLAGAVLADARVRFPSRTAKLTPRSARTAPNDL